MEEAQAVLSAHGYRTLLRPEDGRTPLRRRRRTFEECDRPGYRPGSQQLTRTEGFNDKGVPDQVLRQLRKCPRLMRL